MPEGTAGDTPGEASTLAEMFNAGSAEAGNAGTDQAPADQPTDTPAPEQEAETAPGEQAKADTEQPKADDWKGKFEEREKSYRELERRFGQQGSELGTLRKELESMRKQLPQPKTDDPYEADEVLKNLSPAQRKVFEKATAAQLKAAGIDPAELKQMRDAIGQMYQQNRAQTLAGEVQALKSRVGEENFEKYREHIRQWYEENNWEPRPLEQVYKLVSYDDLAKGQVQRTEELRKSREERAKTADTGKPGPKAQPNLGPDAESLTKMSNKQAFDSILKAVQRG